MGSSSSTPTLKVGYEALKMLECAISSILVGAVQGGVCKFDGGPRAQLGGVMSLTKH